MISLRIILSKWRISEKWPITGLESRTNRPSLTVGIFEFVFAHVMLIKIWDNNTQIPKYFHNLYTILSAVEAIISTLSSPINVYQCTNEYLFWSESNIEYYSPQPNCPNRIANIIRAVKYIRIVQNIRIFEYSNIFE